jgi:hypothetical protein
MHFNASFGRSQLGGNACQSARNPAACQATLDPRPYFGNSFTYSHENSGT